MGKSEDKSLLSNLMREKRKKCGFFEKKIAKCIVG